MMVYIRRMSSLIIICFIDTCLQQKLKVYLAPFLYGNRYTSFGRHFTKVEKLEEVILLCFLTQGYSNSLSYFSPILLYIFVM